MSILLDFQVVDRSTDSGDDIYAHYADASDITRAMVLGVEITALCGKTWIPSRAPENYPVCAKCEEIYKSIENI